MSEDEIVKAYQNEIDNLVKQGISKDIQYNNSMYGSKHKQNLIEWELDFKPELDEIIRLLRCDVLMNDENGNEYWGRNPDQSRIFFNDLGVNDLIRNIIILVNKNKALSNYSPEEINERVRQIKHEIRVLIYNNYEDYGMDNDYKMNNYSMVVLTVGSIIEDVYRRAMNGATHQGLNEQRIVTQNEPLGGQNYQMQSSSPKKLWNPFSWNKK